MNVTAVAEDTTLDEGATLSAVEAAVQLKRYAEADILRLAVDWADQHPGDRVGSSPWTPKGGEEMITVGGEGTPKIAEFAPAELAVSLQVHPLGARSLIADALDLRHRLPSLWTLVTEDLSLPDWVARKIARATRELTGVQVAEVDRQLADIAATLPPSRLLEKVDAMVLAADDEARDDLRQAQLDHRCAVVSSGRRQHGPPQLPTLYARLDEADAQRLDQMLTRLAKALKSGGDTDPTAVRRSKALGLLADPERALSTLTGGTADARAPHTVLYLHLTESAFRRDEGGVARFEGAGPITPAQAREILGHSRVTIRPVLDLEKHLPADAYEFTGSLREQVLLRTPADCYPFAVRVGGSMDVDHTTSYDADGPPGQTTPANAGPMTRHHHRIKTHGPMAVRQPRPGLYVWRTPYGRYCATDHRGTRRIDPTLGDGIYGDSAGERQAARLLLDYT